MGACQHHGPLLSPLNARSTEDPKVTIILISTHMRKEGGYDTGNCLGSPSSPQ